MSACVENRYEDGKSPARDTVMNQPVRPEINKALVRLAHLLDEAVQIPGTSYRVGLDGLIGLIPGLGDVVTALAGFLLLKEAKRLGVPKERIARIVAAYLIDLGVGFIPVLGDIFDFAYKANTRSLKIMQDYLRSQARS